MSQPQLKFEDFTRNLSQKYELPEHFQVYKIIFQIKGLSRTPGSFKSPVNTTVHQISENRHKVEQINVKMLSEMCWPFYSGFNVFKIRLTKATCCVLTHRHLTDYYTLLSSSTVSKHGVQAKKITGYN